MNNREPIKEELKSLNSTLDAAAAGMPYSVPEGYFEGLVSSVMARLKNQEPISVKEELEMLSPMLAGIPKTMPFSVPDQYFASNIDTLKAVVNEPEVLSFSGREMPYEVPSAYFDKLPAQILEKVSKPEAKLIPMMRRKWARLAVAAMITGIIAVSGIAYFNSKKDISVDNPAWVANKLKTVPDKTIDEFVKITDVNAASMVTVKKQNKPADSRKLLQDIPDKELDAFLQQLPADEELDVN
ncbi:MAG: hypothetical protein ACJ75B_07575 [Flavisolibacter sp.]